MAQEYMAMGKRDKGLVALNTNVFTSIAMICVEEDKNVKLADAAPFKSNVSSKVVDDRLIIELNIIVKYNVNVQETCAGLQHKIHEDIKHMCEIDPDEIDVKVVGFDFGEQ